MDNTIEYFIKTNYNLFPTARSGRYRCICPFCNNSKQKFYFDFALGFYKCFHCNNYGKLPYFIYLRHSQEKNLYYNAINYYKNSKQSKFPMSLPADFKFLKGNASNIAKEYILYFLSRGIPLNMLYAANTGYSATLSYQLIFPVYNEFNQQVYYTTRAIKNSIKEKTYNPAYVDNTYGKGDVLYGIHHACAHNNVYIVEGVFDYLSLKYLKYNVVAALGKTLTDSQIELLKSCEFNTITLCFDGEAISSTLQTAKQLKSKNIAEYINYCNLPYDSVKDDPNDLFLSGTLINYLLNPIVYTQENALLARLTNLHKINKK